jgi:hypothetical protein
MAVYGPDIPPHLAQLIRHFPPELKRSVKQAVRVFKFKPILRRATASRVSWSVEIQSQTISHHL